MGTGCADTEGTVTGHTRKSAAAVLEMMKRQESRKMICSLATTLDTATATATVMVPPQLKHVCGVPVAFNISKRFWGQLLRLALAERVMSESATASARETAVGVIEVRWRDLTKAEMNRLAGLLTECKALTVTGKGVFKEEFVSAGGVDCREVDWRTMQSKRTQGVYFAGELLNVDGVTGGFNFQNAWSSGWVAAQHMSR